MGATIRPFFCAIKPRECDRNRLGLRKEIRTVRSAQERTLHEALAVLSDVQEHPLGGKRITIEREPRVHPCLDSK